MKNTELDIFLTKIIAIARKKAQEGKYDKVFFNLVDVTNVIIETTNTEYTLKELTEYIHVSLNEAGYMSAEQVFFDLKRAIDEEWDQYSYEAANEDTQRAISLATMLDDLSIEPQEYSEYYINEDFEFLTLPEAARIFVDKTKWFDIHCISKGQCVNEPLYLKS